MKRLVLMAAAAAIGLATPAIAQPINTSVCGASPGGIWSLVGQGLDSTVKAEVPGSTVTYQTSSGGLANVVQVKSGACAFGMANDGDLLFAKDGTAPFKAPVTGLKAIAVLYDWTPVWWIARKDFVEKYGIQNLGDLATKKPPVRLVLNRRGLLTTSITESELKALGVTLKDIESWGGSVQYQASEQQSDLMKDGRVDLLANTLFEGHRSLAQMAEGQSLVLIGTPQTAVQAVMKEFALKPWTISAEANPWDKTPIETVTTSIILFADEKMDDNTAYLVTKSMIDHPDKMASVSAAMKRFTPKGMLAQDILPFHPGAIRAYTEAGLMK